MTDYGDPHGADEKDNALSSIEYLRIHQGIFVNHKRERIKTGLDEIQEKILTLKPINAYAEPGTRERETEEPLLIVDPSCRIFIDALLGGYHRGFDGKPEKDGYFDHLVDCSRYGIVHNMNRVLAAKRQHRRYRPKNIHTGY